MAKSELKKFEFTVEVINKFREKKVIPVNFFNASGQTLIQKKENATEAEIKQLLKFIDQGIFYKVADTDALYFRNKNQDGIPQGLSNTKLLSRQITEQFSEHTSKLFSSLKKSHFPGQLVHDSSKLINNMFDDFEKQPDAMTGLVNIIELMSGSDNSYQVELAVKRTVTAMAIKTRGMKAILNYFDKIKTKEIIHSIMLSAFFCDIGYFRMNLPESYGLSVKEMDYIKGHPLMSYLLLAHDKEIPTKAKHSILIHHGAKHDSAVSNNYPKVSFLKEKLANVQSSIKNNPDKKIVFDDIDKQLTLLESIQPYHEDANIIALSSEFASLTSRVPWREALEPLRAVKMIINNSFFTHSKRIVREFLDYVAISLCNNKMIIREGDFIIIGLNMYDGSTMFEVCQVLSVNRFQSQPEVIRIATVRPNIEKMPKLYINGFNLKSLKPDPRKAYFNLSKDDSRFMVYLVDPSYDKHLYEYLRQLAVSGRRINIEKKGNSDTIIANNDNLQS